MATKSPKKVISSTRPRGYSRIQTENEDLRKIQENIASAVEGLDKNILLKNKILYDIDLGPEETDIIQHGLGRCPNGWNIIKRSGPGQVWQVTLDEKIIELQSDTSVTVSILVF